MMIKQTAVLLALTVVSSLRGNHYKSFSCFSLDIMSSLVLSNILILIFPDEHIQTSPLKCIYYQVKVYHLILSPHNLSSLYSRS